MTKMLDERLGKFLVGEAVACQLLSRAFYKHPDQPWLDRLVSNRIFFSTPINHHSREFKQGLLLLEGWARGQRHSPPLESQDDIEQDYMRLFVGPQQLKAPPWASVYLSPDGILFQRETRQVKAVYENYGLELSCEYNEPADHVGLEFEFLAHVSRDALDALKLNDKSRLKILVDTQLEFIEKHMLRWIPEWLSRVEAGAQTVLYRGLATLGCGLLKDASLMFRSEAIA